MDFVINLALSVLSLLAMHLLAEAVCSRLSPLHRWIICRAASIAPPFRRARDEEEWLAHIEDCGSHLHKFFHAFGCMLAAVRLRDDWEFSNGVPFADTSFVYRFLTNFFFTLDCAILASMFFAAIPLLPVVVFGYVYEVITRRPFNFNVDYFFDRYWDRLERQFRGSTKRRLMDNL